jgi:type 1 glutamine amidotransferase
MKKILILHGGWAGHEPGPCAELFKDQLSRRGFTVDTADTLDALTAASGLSTYSAIVPIWTMGTISKEQEKALSTAVLGGVGLAGFHGGMGDSFRGSIEYQWMVGGQFLAHPDNFKNYRVEIIQRDDPIMAGCADFDVHTEQYYMMIDPGVEVLATTKFGESASAPWTRGVVMPVVWKKSFGAGRIFYSALGHSAKEFTEVPMQLEITLRGIAWAAGGV